MIPPLSQTTDSRGRPLAPRLLLVALGLVVVFVALCFLPASPTATRDTGEFEPTLAAIPPVGQLSPSHPTHTELEDAQEVRSLRAAFAALTWAALQMSCDFPEIHVWIHPESLFALCPNTNPPDPGHLLDRIRPVGPLAFEPLEVSHDSDGAAIVTVCTQEPQLTRDTVTHEPFDAGQERHNRVSWRLLPSELAAADGDQVFQLTSVIPTTSIDSCEPVHPITAQRFEGWSTTPAFAFRRATRTYDTARQLSGTD